MSFLHQLEARQKEFLAALAAASTQDAVLDVEKAFFGRKGSLTVLVKQINALSAAERPAFGRRVNEIKREMGEAIRQRRAALGAGAGKATEDITLPGTNELTGSRHPLMVVQQRIEDIFRTMGYEILFGPEIELAKYNFDLLRIPENHPARDVWDTFYVGGVKPSSAAETPLLRTHISPMQIRVMEKRKPPIRMISPGRVFRHEATDATHEANYFYCEGMAIEQGLTFGDLMGTLRQFFKALFGPDVEIRSQPSFFPFVEPGAEILMKGKHGWLEMLGCGMIHPEVLRNMRVDPKEFSGFAFGIGIDRIAMHLHAIPDIRLSYQGDLRFLQQF